MKQNSKMRKSDQPVGINRSLPAIATTTATTATTATTTLFAWPCFVDRY
jgi:hypothetical protein